MVSVIHHFCYSILKDDDIWWIVTRSIAQQIKNRLT
jgi:hypothetical protein